MTITITLGGLSDDDSADAGIALPFVEALPAVALMQDAMHQALTQRVGIIVHGAKGVGKTEARRYALDMLQRLEDEREEADANYQRRNVLLLPAVREDRYERALAGFYLALSNGAMPLLLRGRRRTNDELRMELVDQLLLQNRLLLVIEELERASPAFLQALRDIMVDAKERDTGGVVEIDGVRHLRAAGIGMVAIGTDVAYRRIQTSAEAGHSWASVREIPLLATADVAALLCLWFPQFMDTIAARGDLWWDALVQTRLCTSRPRPTRLVAHAARIYLRYMMRLDVRYADPRCVPLQEEVLLRAWADAAWGDAPSDATRGSSAPADPESSGPSSTEGAA